MTLANTPTEMDSLIPDQNEQKTIEEMKTIRQAHHEPGHNRLANFEQREHGAKGIDLDTQV